MTREDIPLEDIRDLDLDAAEEKMIKLKVGDETLDLSADQVALIRKTLKSGVFDYNTYATKKTIAQGLMDISLLSANAFQLRAIIQSGSENQFFYPLIVLISISISLQILVALLLLFIGKTDIPGPDERKADRVNNISTGVVVLITILNVIISAFGPGPKQRT